MLLRKQLKKKNKFKAAANKPKFKLRLVYDVLPPIRAAQIKRASRQFLGLKPYPSAGRRFLAIGWRVATAAFLFFFFISGLRPWDLIYASFNSLMPKTKVFNFYTASCWTEPEPIHYREGWWNFDKIYGRPQIGPTGDFYDFSADNSVFYNGGNFNLICDQFNSPVLETEEEEIDKLRSAKIKFSLALSELDATDLPRIALPVSKASSSKNKTYETISGEIKGENKITKNETGEGEGREEVKKSRDVASSTIEKVSSSSPFSVSTSSTEVEVIEPEEKGQVEVINWPEDDEKSEAGSLDKVNRTDEVADIDKDKEMPEKKSSSAKTASSTKSVENERKREPFSEALENKSFFSKNLGDKINYGDSNDLEGDDLIPKQSVPESESSIKTSADSGEEAANEEPSLPTKKDTSDNNKEISLLNQIKKFFRAAIVRAQNKEAKIIVWYRIDKTDGADGTDRLGEDKKIKRGEGNKKRETSFAKVIDDKTESKALSASSSAKVTEDNYSFASSSAEATVDKNILEDGENQGEEGSEKENKEWKELASFSGSYLTNAVNGDYFSYDAPFLKTIEDIKNLKIKLEARSGGQTAFTVYLDSVWVEAKFTLKKEKGKSDVLKLDEKEIPLFYTDENNDENLIIKTDQKIYTGLTQTEVYFSVTNTTWRRQDFNLQVHFPADRGQVKEIEFLNEDVPYVSLVPDYGTKAFYCSSGWNKEVRIVSGEDPVKVYHCDETAEKKPCHNLDDEGKRCYLTNVKVGEHKEIRYRHQWEKIPLNGRPIKDERNWLARLLGFGLERKPIPEEFVPKAVTGGSAYSIEPGAIQYFRMLIKFPPATSGEFYIEAIGESNAYGLLDPWWSSSWSYRLPITIDNTNNDSALTEYQIYMEISSTTADFWEHVKSDGGDIRFLNADNSTELNYWIQYWNYASSSAAIWVQADEIPATSTTKIYLYYGNSSATTTSNMYDTFTYSTTTPIYYVVNNDLSGASIKVVSLIDNNVVQLDNGTPVSLNRQQITTFTTFSATSIIKAKGPVHAKIADEENADALVPIAFASRQFTVPSTRGSELFYLYSPFATATIDLYDSGTKITAQTKTIGPGQATTTSYDIGTMAIIEATVPVLLSFENDTPADGLVAYPTTDRDLYGVISNYNYIGVASSATNFIIYCSGGASTTVANQARGTRYSNTTCTSAGEGNGDMVRIANINKVSLGAIQQADSDGYESSVYLPAKEFSTEYMVPTDAAYITVACAPKGGTVNLSIYDENNTFVTSGTCSPSGELPGKAYFGTGDTATYLAGSRIVSTNGVPFYAYYEDVTAPGAAGGGDENNLWGATQFRKLSYPEPTVNIGSEEPLSPPEGSFVSANQKGDGSGRVDVSIAVSDASHDECKAKIEFATGTACNFTSPGDPTLDETDANIAATYGDPDIDNNYPYQVGTTTGWIVTLYGTNTIQFDWLTKNDLPSADGEYCLRLTVNDGIFDQATSATTTLIVDNIAPSAPGALSFYSKTGSAITLSFGATSTESHFREYIIYYKEADGTAPTENDNVWASTSDASLADQDFNGAATTTITGLTKGTTYSFAVWAYDNYGNRASSTWINVTANDEPTGSFNSAALKTNGSGRVDISIEVDDANNDDTNRAKIEFATGTACDFSFPGDPTLDESDANIIADFGTPVIDNNQSYQVGSSTGWIITSPGSNTVQFDWLTQSDLPSADGEYCLRLTVNDGIDDQLVSATTTLILDNVAPTAPGSLTEGETTLDSITLIFATSSPATDTNEPTTNAYRIFYKQGTGGVTESDTEHDDNALDAYDYNGATSTTVTGLDSNTWYVFNIWAYDAYGNKTSATEIAIKTKATLSNDSLTLTNALSSGTSTNIVVADGGTEWNFRAVVTETNGWYAIASTTLRLADASDNSSPFSDLEFYWDQTADQFYEIGNDTLGAVTLADTSTSTCSGNTCTLDFKLIFNKNFATSSVEYTAELYSANDSGTTDKDTYNNFYQVRITWAEQIHYRWRNDDGGE
jgi:hypothetical protein